MRQSFHTTKRTDYPLPVLQKSLFRLKLDISCNDTSHFGFSIKEENVKGVLLYSADNIGNYSNSEESNSRAVDSNPTVYDIVNSISSTEEYLSSYQKMMENPVADNSYYLSFSLETQFGKAQFSFDFVNEAGFNEGIPQESVFSLNNASFNIYIRLDNIQFNAISSAASADVYYQDSRLSGNSLKYQLIE